MIENNVIFTAAERASAMELDNPHGGAGCLPFPVTAPSPGVGLNINDQAASFGAGDPVPLTGKYVAPVAMVNNQEYIDSAPALVAFLITLPWAMLDSETIFYNPPEEEG